MKNIKRILAMALVIITVMSFAGCHKKNEIAVNVGDVEFTSAYYMCALMSADSEAKAKIEESLTDEEKEKGEIDYYSKKVDGKDYVTWVEDSTVTALKKIAAYKTLCKENKLELDKDTVSNSEMYTTYYWSNYGYSSYFEPNGVSLDTFNAYQTDALYSERYFEFLYGKEGEKEIAIEDVKTKMYENFITANLLEGQYTSEMTDTEKATLKTKFDGYVKALQSGAKTFEAIYKEYNNITDEQAKEETAEESEEKKAKDQYASVLGAEDTDYASDHYETAKAMKTGEVKLVELEDGSGLVIIVKQDIKADDYYLDQLDMTVRHMIADEEYDKEIDTYVKTLKADINKYATGQFKVKKIKVPEQA